MNYFFWSSIVLLIATAIYYVIFFSLAYYWHEKKTSYVIVPLLYTFEFFSIGFLVVCAFSLLAQYWPDILRGIQGVLWQ